MEEIKEEKKKVEVEVTSVPKPKTRILEPIRKLNTLESIILQEGIHIKASPLQKATSFTVQDAPQMGHLQAPLSHFYNVCQSPTDCEEQRQDTDLWKPYQYLFQAQGSKDTKTYPMAN